MNSIDLSHHGIGRGHSKPILEDFVRVREYFKRTVAVSVVATAVYRCCRSQQQVLDA